MFYGPRFPLTPVQQGLYRIERWRRHFWPGLLKPPPRWTSRYGPTNRWRRSLRLQDLRA